MVILFHNLFYILLWSVLEFLTSIYILFKITIWRTMIQDIDGNKKENSLMKRKWMELISGVLISEWTVNGGGRGLGCVICMRRALIVDIVV